MTTLSTMMPLAEVEGLWEERLDPGRQGRGHLSDGAGLPFIVTGPHLAWPVGIASHDDQGSRDGEEAR